MTLFQCTHPDQVQSAIVRALHEYDALKMLANTQHDTQWKHGTVSVVRIEGTPEVLSCVSSECPSSVSAD